MGRPRDEDGVLVVGAGAAGLVTLKVLQEHGIAAEAVERRGDVGGLFAARPDPSVHLVAPASASAFTGLPFAVPGAVRPSFAQAHAYLGAYAAHHDLRRRIRLSTTVTRMEPRPDGGWSVTTDGGEQRDHRAVVLAVGRAAGRRRFAPGDPGYPVVPAACFGGAEQVAGRAVLVLGDGRAACDVALEAALSARRTLLTAGGGRVPPLVAAVLARRHGDHGLPRPDPRLFGSRRRGSRRHDRFRPALLRGEIEVRPPVVALADGRAVFRGGASEPVDVVVDATGGPVDVPFLDHWRLPWADGAPHLLLDVAHPVRPDLFAAGLVRTAAPTWPILELQARLIARLADADPDAVAAFRRDAARADRRGLRIAPRPYRRALRRAEQGLARRGRGARQAAPIQAT